MLRALMKSRVVWMHEKIDECRERYLVVLDLLPMKKKIEKRELSENWIKKVMNENKEKMHVVGNGLLRFDSQTKQNFFSLI